MPTEEEGERAKVQGETSVAHNRLWRERRFRIGLLGACLGIAAIILMGGFVSSVPGPGRAGLTPFAGSIVIPPPYAHPILLTTTTWAAGGGSLVWPGSPNAFPGTGQVILDEHSTANVGVGGHYGGNAGEAGFIDSYTCGASCTGKSSITFNWTVNPGGVWYTQIEVNCTNGSAQAEFATYGQVWQGPVLVSQAIMTISDLFSTTFGTHQIVTGTGPITPVLTFTVPGGFVNGTTYTFDSFVWSQGSAMCPAHSLGGNAYSEVDIGNRGYVHLVNIVLS